jgi:hypothetical protein
MRGFDWNFKQSAYFSYGALYIFNLCMTFWISGGTKNENGRDTANPIPQPDSHAAQKWAFIPTLMAAIASDMHKDIRTAIQDPKNNI